MNFREIKEDDVPVVKSFIKDIFGEDYIFEVSQDDFHKTFILEKNDIIAVIQFWSLFEESEITLVAVKKEFQNQGYGKILIERTFEYLKEKSVKSVYLEVAIDNEPAKKLYEKLGFKFLTIRQKYYTNGKDAIVMKKDLKE
jgi:ribosomal-protein-alanine N-acetyltransferase